MDSPAYHAAPLPPDPKPIPAAPVATSSIARRPGSAVGASAATGAPASATPDARAAGGKALLRTAAGFYGITCLFALGYALFSGTISTLLGDQSPAAGSVLAALVVGLAIVGLCRLGDRTMPRVHRAWDALAAILGPLDTGPAVVLSLLSGVAEELLFRGALWPHLGLWGTTLLFGLVHVIPKRSLWIYPIFATGAGLVLGLLRNGSGSVVPPMIAHAIVNGINLVLLARRKPVPHAA